MNQATSRFIDTARWIAATFVALHHCHGVFVNQADIMSAPHAPPVYVWWFLTAYTFAHGAVVVFFVLSGFLVGGAVIERARAGKAYLRTYLIDRTSRIYVVLLPTLALCAILDLAGRQIFAGLGVYEQSFYVGAFQPIYLLGSLVNMQGIWTPVFGTDMALWSLGMEYWYYIVCALLLLPLCSAYAKGLRWAGFALGVVLFVALAASPSYFAFGACVWAFGALMRIAPRPLMRSKWLALVCWLAVVGAMRIGTRGAILEAHPVKELVDAANALLFGNLLLSLRFDAGEGFSWCRRQIHHRLADFSYTLYAVHMPLLAWLWALAAWCMGPGWRLQLATPAHYAAAVGALVLLMLASFALSRVTEARTGDVRAWLRRVIPG